ncbi:transposase [Blastopirellula marina]|uniref:Transposase n=1 Tax=Blastopirellula marina DSM 3645 TaxID=314230 RepID=A4A251_9BACT|nr:transposase [Blastopirellula marina]EAQ77154.1 transposase [Blastopirellula marina DSM 3645]
MLTFGDHQNGDLFDPWEHLGPKRLKLLERSWAGVFREFLLKQLPVGKLAEAFRKDLGRPTKDLYVALGALILQQLHDFTDRQTTEAVALNMTWHYALDIRRDADAYLCERTIRNYRQKVLAAGLDQVLFQTLTDRLIEEMGVDTGKQRLDSTAVKSAIRGLTRLGILVEATSKFLRELKRKHAALYADVAPDTIRKYVERSGDGCFGDTRPSESKKRLPEAAQDVFELIQQFRAAECSTLESYQLLRRVFDEQCEVDENSATPVSVRPPHTTACAHVINPADPDARYNKHRGPGYLVQIMETYEESHPDEQEQADPPKPDLITYVAVNPMTMHDKDALTPAMDCTEQRGVKPKELLADSHYGSTECLEKGRARDVEIVSPAQTPKGKLQGKLTLEDFELAEDGRITRCPHGQEPKETSVAGIRLQVVFTLESCATCPHRERCPASSVGRSSARYQYTHDRVHLWRRRQKERGKEFRDRYRWRAGVEATMSRFKYQMGMASLRVRGMTKITYTATLRALGLNIQRVAAYRLKTG